MIDLHLHSNHSDGKLSIKELAEKVSEFNIQYCSLTDHDSIGGVIEMEKIINDKSIKFVNGVEFSVLYKQQEIHILAYDFDMKEMGTVLEERNRIVENKRVKELSVAINLFRKKGFVVSKSLQLKAKKTVGLLVALDVYGNKDNQELIKKQYGHLLNEKEFYDEYQAPGQSCYVPKSGINLDWFLEKIKSIECDKILAHPFVPVSFLVKPLIKKDIDYLISRGLDGVEVYHDRNTKEQVDFLKQYVIEKKLLFTGGSDSHGRSGNTAIGHYGEGKKIPEFKLTNHQSLHV